MAVQNRFTRGYRGSMRGLCYSPSLTETETRRDSWRDQTRLDAFIESLTKSPAARLATVLGE